MDYAGCSAMALACLERAKIDVKNKDKWTAEAERWDQRAVLKILGERRRDSLSNDARGTDGSTASVELAVHPHSRAEVTADCSVYSTNIANVNGSRRPVLYCCRVSTLMRAAWRLLSR